MAQHKNFGHKLTTLENNITLSSDNVMETVIRCFSALIFGNDSKTNTNQLATGDKGIYWLINDIKTYLDNTKTNPVKVEIDKISDSSTTLKYIENTLTMKIESPDDLNSFIKNIQEFKDANWLKFDNEIFDKIQLLQNNLNNLATPNLEGIIKSIKKLTEKDKIPDLNTAKDNIDAIIEFFKGDKTKKSVARLMGILNEINLEAKDVKLDNVAKTFNIINTVLQTFDLDNKQLNQNFLGTLVFELGEKGNIKKIIDRLNNMPSVNDNVEDVVDKLYDAVNIILRFDDFDYDKAASIDFGLTFINDMLDETIPITLTYINRLEISDDIINKLDVLNTVFSKLDFDEVLPSTTSILKGQLKLLGINIEMILAATAMSTLANLIESIDEAAKTSNLGESINSFIGVDKECLEKLDLLSSAVKKLYQISLLSKVASIGTIALKGLEKSVDGLTVIVDKLNKIDAKDLTNLNKTLDTLKRIIITSAGILIMGSLVVTLGFIDPGALFSFSKSLGLFIIGVAGVFILAGKFVKNTLEIAEEFAKIVAVSALILILGSSIASPETFANAMLFTFELGLFMAAIFGTFKIIGSGVKSAIEGAKDMALLIGVCAGILIFGGLVVDYIDLGSLFLFTVILAGFLFSIYRILRAANKWGTAALNGAKEMAILVGVSGLILITAGLLVKYIDLWGLSWFTFILGVFIAGITSIFIFAKSVTGSAMKGAAGLAILVAVSAGILLLGASIIRDDWELVGWIALFGALLAGFVWLITWVYNKNAKRIYKAFGAAAGLALLTAIAGATLLLGGYILYKNEGLWESVLGFTAILGAYVFTMSKILSNLGSGKNAVNMLKGEGLMALLLVITYGATKVVDSIVKLLEGKSGQEFFSELIKGILGIAGMITAIGGIAYAAGALVTGPQALIFAAGVGAMATIEGLAFGAAKCLQAIAISMKMLNSIKEFNSDMIIKNIKGFTSIALELKPIADNFNLITKASTAIFSLSQALSKIAIAIKDWSDLRIPVYTGTKITGYKNINDQDIEDAAAHIKAVVITLAESVVEVYNEKPELFNDPLIGDTPFVKVSKSLKTLGPMLSSIADGIKDWATLRIPVYSGTKIVRYETMSGKHFDKAKGNIKNVIMALGEAVIETYDYAKKRNMLEIFDSEHWWGGGDSKFSKVAKSLKSTGAMLAQIATGIKQWVNMAIPVEFDPKTGKPTKYTSLTDTEIGNAKEHIKKVIVAFGEAVMDVVKNDKTGVFNPSRNKNLNEAINTSLEVVCNALKNINGINGEYQSIVKNKIDPEVIRQCINRFLGIVKTISFNMKPIVDDDDYNDDVVDTINKYIGAIDSIVRLVESSKNIGEQDYNVLRDGIVKMYEVTSTMKPDSGFVDYTEKFKKYVESINSVKLSNVTKLQTLVDSLNQLSARMGNLDKLTEVLSTKLNNTLFELVNQLRKAEASINNAHELQNKRKKLIEESVSKIQNIMNQHMIVEISQAKEGEEDKGDHSQINGTPAPEGAQNSDESLTSQTPTLSNPENTQTSSKPGASKKSYNGKNENPFKVAPLTKEEFIAYMEEHFKNTK